MSLIGNPKSAEWYRTQYSDISGEATFTASTDDTTLVTGKTGWTIRIQRIIGYVTTDAAQSVVFEDSNSSAVKVAEITTSPGDETRWDFDFGARGKSLTEAKNFLVNVSAAGVAFHTQWEGYLIQTGTEYIPGRNSNTSGQVFA